MTYFFTAGFYHDCPTCDSFNSDAEDIYMSPIHPDKYSLIKDIQKHIGEYQFFSICTIGDYGEVKTATDNIINHNYAHRVQEVKFELEGHSYSFDGYGNLKDTTDEGYKRLYLDE